jgi:hypothetical protein
MAALVPVVDGAAESPGLVEDDSPTGIIIREPSSHTLGKPNVGKPSSKSMASPTYDWLSGTWQVVYSTLPMWNDKINVRITYSSVTGQAPSGFGGIPDLNDLVEYQKAKTRKVSSIHGVSQPVSVEGVAYGLAYHWRGKGLLKIASSDWEILGWGRDEETSNDWIVTFFSKTLFTPAGIDIYCRDPKILSKTTFDGIKKELFKTSQATLAGTIFEIPNS